MDGRSPFTLAEEFAAAQDWWREAGVDLDFADATSTWLREPEAAADPERPVRPTPVVKPKAEPPRPKIGGVHESWPQDLAAFGTWWLTEPSLDTCGARPRIPPRGVKGAKLMVLVPEPEAGDTETLLSGPVGKLLSSFLAAAGIGAEDIYVASALPRHTPHPDWSHLAESGLGSILLHHIGLVTPERILAFGRDVLPLIGHDPAQTAQSLLQINQGGRSTPLFAERSLDFLLARPAARSGFWQRWLDWTGTI